MDRSSTPSTRIRSMVWLAAVLMWILTMLIWGGGIAQLQEYVNDLF